MFLCDNHIEHFQHFNFEKKILKNENLFRKTGVPLFSWKYISLQTALSEANVK